MAHTLSRVFVTGALAGYTLAEYTPNFEGEIEFQANATDISNACIELVSFKHTPLRTDR